MFYLMQVVTTTERKYRVEAETQAGGKTRVVSNDDNWVVPVSDEHARTEVMCLAESACYDKDSSWLSYGELVDRMDQLRGEINRMDGGSIAIADGKVELANICLELQRRGYRMTRSS